MISGWSVLWVWMSCYWLTRVLPAADEQARNRFQLELEFVQCLANPNYLNCKWLCDQKLAASHLPEFNEGFVCLCFQFWLREASWGTDPSSTTWSTCCTGRSLSMPSSSSTATCLILGLDDFLFEDKVVMFVNPSVSWPLLCDSAPCRYPHCLHMLELLQYEHFRKELVNAQCAKFIDEQQLLHWQHYSRKRMRLQQALAEQTQAQPQTAPPHGNAAAKWRRSWSAAGIPRLFLHSRGH